jgi:hypothetical protein
MKEDTIVRTLLWELALEDAMDLSQYWLCNEWIHSIQLYSVSTNNVCALQKGIMKQRAFYSRTEHCRAGGINGHYVVTMSSALRRAVQPPK